VSGFRARLVFDPARGEYRDGDIRYMMIRPDALMGMIAELPEHMRVHAMDAFARSIRRFGGRSARAYRDAGAAEASALLHVIEETAPQLGWGRWRIAADADGFVVTVENSPFAAGAGPSTHAVCAPILGMLAAVGEMTHAAVSVAETACAAMGAPSCRFEVRRQKGSAATPTG